MRVLIKEPGKPWVVALIPNTLEALQQAVGGYIETYTIDPQRGLVIICDEEGRLADKPFNLRIDGIDFVGTLLLCGFDKDDGEFYNVPDWVVRVLSGHEKW